MTPDDTVMEYEVATFLIVLVCLLSRASISQGILIVRSNLYSDRRTTIYTYSSYNIGHGPKARCTSLVLLLQGGIVGRVWKGKREMLANQNEFSQCNVSHA